MIISNDFFNIIVSKCECFVILIFFFFKFKTSMMPIFKNRTLEDLEWEYNYDFKLENDIIMQFLS